jgi:hypothetical protein
MIYAINYANSLFKKKQKFNSFTAKYIGKVDKVISYSNSDIDSSFYKLNEKVLSVPRGNGLWLWKPYIIHKTLLNLNDGDYLIYTDSGTIYYRNVRGLIKQLEGAKQELMVFDLSCIEVNWTKQAIFDYLQCNHEKYKFTNHRTATILVFKKTENAIKLVTEWLETASKYEIISDEIDIPSRESSFFIENRHDQSILSLLTKKYNIKAFSDPTDSGHFKINILPDNVFFYNNKKDYPFKINNIYFLVTRQNNTIRYILKFFYKKIMNKLYH